MTLYGWDASDFDWSRGPMDLAAAKADGVSIFTHKATEGTSTEHVHYGTALNRAKAAGIPYLGAYLVARTGNVAAEVDYFLAYVNAQTPWWSSYPGWFWQIDLEKWPYDAVSAGTGEAVADTLAARTGKPTLIYASKGQYANGLAGTSHPLWNASYGSNPAKHYREAYPGDGGSGWGAYSGRTPILWQYGSKLTIGRQPTCDGNAVRDEAAFKALFGDDVNLTDKLVIPNWDNDPTLSSPEDSTVGTALGVASQRSFQALRASQACEKAVADLAAKMTAPTPVQVDAAAVAAALAGNEAFVAAIVDGVDAKIAARMAS